MDDKELKEKALLSEKEMLRLMEDVHTKDKVAEGEFVTRLQEITAAAQLAKALALLQPKIEEKLPKCGICRGVMSKNPHPDAGKPDSILSVGAEYECIPCEQRALHAWADRARKAESEIEEARRQGEFDGFAKGFTEGADKGLLVGQKSELRRILEWGDECCFDKEHIAFEGSTKLRRLCSKCWQALKGGE